MCKPTLKINGNYRLPTRFRVFFPFTGVRRNYSPSSFPSLLRITYSNGRSFSPTKNFSILLPSTPELCCIRLRRISETTSLGDRFVQRRRFPGGLGILISAGYIEVMVFNTLVEWCELLQGDKISRGGFV